jgi:hypothetical protein
MAGSIRHAQRLSMGAGAVLTLNEAAALLPVSDSDARGWLRRAGLVSFLSGRPVVVWAAVLAELRAGAEPGDSAPPPALVPFPRVNLDPL